MNQAPGSSAESTGKGDVTITIEQHGQSGIQLNDGIGDQPVRAVPVQQHISRVSVRAPPFWKENPALWFRQLESQFITNGITVSETKYHVAVGALDTAIISQISDIIMNPPEHGKYENLKERLQERFADSEERRFQKLLRNLDLGDKKPSHLWREMRDLAGPNINDPLLKSLWLQRLPAQVQAIVSTDEGAMPRLLTMADKINEIIENRNIHVVADASSARSLTPLTKACPPAGNQDSSAINAIERLCSQVTLLTQQVAALTNDDNNNQSRGRSATRASTSRQRFQSRSQSREPNQSRICWYHQRFGNRATRCTTPCAFIPPTEN